MIFKGLKNVLCKLLVFVNQNFLFQATGFGDAQNGDTTSKTQRNWMEAARNFSKISHSTQGLREGVQQVHCTRAKEYERTHAESFCNQAQNYLRKPIADNN